MPNKNNGFITAIIADDHAIVRSGVREVLETSDRVKIVAEVGNGLEAIAETKSKKPDLIVLDINMPYAGGVEVVTEIQRWSKATRIVIFSGIHSPAIFADLKNAGVAGILLKKDSTSEIEQGFAALLAGKNWFGASVLELIDEVKQASSLSMREHQILQFIAQGKSNTEIASILSISPKTVDNHRSNLMRKLDVHTVVELIRKAIQLELLDPT